MIKRVLIVDDVEFNIDFQEKVIVAHMSELGIEVAIDTATNVEDAIGKIYQNEPYHAMILDMNLPDGTCADIAKVARDKSEKSKIAALTIYPNKYKDEHKYFDLFLKKPITPEIYKDKITVLLEI